MHIETHRDRYQGPKISIPWKLNLEVNVYRETKTSGRAHHGSCMMGDWEYIKLFNFSFERNLTQRNINHFAEGR